MPRRSAAPEVSALPESIRDVSTTEAAFITGLSTKVVNAAIDRREITPRSVRRRGGKTLRRLGVPELVYLALRGKLAGVLSPRVRRRVYQEIKRHAPERRLLVLEANEAAAPASSIEIGGIITLNYDEALAQVVARMRLLRAVEEHVVSDPEIRGGEPVVRGT